MKDKEPYDFSNFFRLDELELFKEGEMEENESEFTCILCGMEYDEEERKEGVDGEDLCETCYVHIGLVECAECGSICNPDDSKFCMVCGRKL